MKKAIIIFLGLAFMFGVGAFIYLRVNTEIYRDRLCVYNTSDYVSFINGGTAYVDIYMIDSCDFFGKEFVEGDTLIITGPGNVVATRDYEIRRLKENSLFSPYEVYCMCIGIEQGNNSVCQYSELQIAGRTIHFDTIVVETVESNTVNIDVGTFVNADDDQYDFSIENHGEDLKVESIEFFMNGRHICVGIEDNVLKTDEKTRYSLTIPDRIKNLIIKPKINVVYGSIEDTIVPICSTVYDMHINDMEISEFLKKMDRKER